MKRMFAALVALLALAVAALPAPTARAAGRTGPPTAASIDAYARAVRDRTGVPGMSVVVTHGGHVVRAAGYGHDSTGAAVTAGTPMRVASVSKSFTAMAVMRLADRHRIALDRPVAAQLPGFRMADPRAARITVRQLLNQTSGLADPGIDLDALDKAASLRDYVSRLRTARLTTAPGTHWAYCNVNYDLAARLVEVASGTPFGTYMRREIFAPLGMARSALSDRVVHPANGYNSLFGAWVSRPEMPAFLADSGAGGVITTAHDMGRWLIAQTGHGRPPVSAHALAEMHTPSPASGDHLYGMGWGVSRDARGVERLEHSGNLFTYTAIEMLVPRTGYGIAVMANGAGLTDAAYETASGLLAMTEGATPETASPVEGLTQPALALATVVALALGTLGAIRARRWSRRRTGRPAWRTVLRLVPAALPMALFAAYPSAISFLSAGRTVTWQQLTYFAAPLTIALAAAALAALATTTLRLIHLLHPTPSPTPTSGPTPPTRNPAPATPGQHP